MTIFPVVVIMVTNGIIVVNIGATDARSLDQINEFVVKAQHFPNLILNVVKNEETLNYIDHNHVDFVLFWDKDIFLATKLQQKGLKLFNTPEAIFMCDDKAMTILALLKANLDTPRYFVFPLHYFGNVYDYYDAYKAQLLSLGFPLVIKERFGSYGDQVYLAHSEEELKALLKTHGIKKLIAQEFLAKHSGTDYRVNVVGSEVISVVKRSNSNDFRSNINQGGTATEVEVRDRKSVV